MAYTPPSVIVFQQFVSQSPVIVPPDLDTLIIGPAYQIQDKLEVPDVNYNPVSGNVFEWPELNLGAKVDLLQHLDVYFEDAVVTVHPESLAGATTDGGNKVKDTTAAFITNGVATEDIIKLTNPFTGVEGTYFVDVVLSETEVRVFGKITFSTEMIRNSVAGPWNIIAGSNDKISISVDGGATQNFTLTANATKSANDIVTDISGTLTGATIAVHNTNQISITSNTTGGTVEVIAVANDAYTTLGLTVGSSLATYRVINGVKDYKDVKIKNPNEHAAADFGVDEDEVTLDPGLSVTSSTGHVYPIESAGKVLISYRALETRFSAEIMDVESLDEIQGKLGPIDVRNPLAVGASLAVQNTISRIRLFAVDEDNTQGYQEVLDRIEDTDEVYCIVPLTQDPVVAGSIKAHVNNLSMPERGKWRIMIWSPELVREKQVQQRSSSGDLEYHNATGILNITDNNFGTFVSSNVVPGDYVRVEDEDEFGNPQSHAGVYLVEETTSEQELTLVNMLYTGEAGKADYTADVPFTTDFLDISISYTVFRILSKTGQAEGMGLIAESFADRRVCQVLPDKITITLSDGDHIVGGEYACCAIGGMVAGAPPHQGFTNLGIAGIKSLFNSNKFFNETQLNAMAEQGVYIIVQSVVGALPFTRHQKTTDTLTLEGQELSIVKTVDFVSYFVKRRLKRVIGVYNITAGTLALISNICNAIVTFLIEQTLPRIGAPLLPDSAVLSVAPHDTFKDQVNVAIDINPPFPVNRIRVDLLI